MYCSFCRKVWPRPELERPRRAQEREAARVVGPVAGFLDRERELDAVGHGDRGADLGHEDAAQPLLRADEAIPEPRHAVRAELNVVPPVPGVGVERPAGGGDGPVEVGRGAVRRHPGQLLGGRVDHVEGGAAGRAGQLAVESSLSSRASTPVPPSASVVVMHAPLEMDSSATGCPAGRRGQVSCRSTASFLLVSKPATLARVPPRIAARSSSETVLSKFSAMASSVPLKVPSACG